MKNLSTGFIAGFIATVVLSAFMLMKSSMELMTQLNIIGMLTNMANNWMGLPATPAVGWIIHFMVGTLLYGFVYAKFHDSLPGHSDTVKGIALALMGWALMMVVLMPMAGKGFMGLEIGMVAPIMTFVLHAVFGAVLGGAYQLLYPKLVHAH